MRIYQVTIILLKFTEKVAFLFQSTPPPSNSEMLNVNISVHSVDANKKKNVKISSIPACHFIRTRIVCGDSVCLLLVISNSPEREKSFSTVLSDK